MGSRDSLKRVKRVVVKIGSALLTDDGRGLDEAAIGGWVEQMALAKRSGIELVLVSSGSVAAGMTRLGWVKRPRGIHELQAAAAIGQMGLVQTYESAFSKFDLHTAQILLDHDDLDLIKEIESIEVEFKSKSTNVAKYIRNLEHLASGIKEVELNQKKRRVSCVDIRLQFCIYQKFLLYFLHSYH